MYCGNCGKQNPDNAVFCQECGAKLYSSGRPAPVQTMLPPVSRKSIAVETARPIGRIVLVGLAAVVLAVLVLLGWIIFGGRGYEETVGQFFSSILDADVESFMELIPPEILEAVDDEADYENLEESFDISKTFLSRLYDPEEYEFSYEIIEDEDLSKSELRDLQEEYEEGIEGIKITQAKTVTVEVLILSADNDVEINNEAEIPVIKIGRSWYLDILNLV